MLVSQRTATDLCLKRRSERLAGNRVLTFVRRASSIDSAPAQEIAAVQPANRKLPSWVKYIAITESKQVKASSRQNRIHQIYKSGRFSI